MKSNQLWRCPVCSHEYRSAIAVTEVLCPNNHIPARGRSARGVMELVEGELPRTELNRKKATSGNRSNRRS